MSREHRRPLFAFVLVTLLCTLVVGNSLTSGSSPSRTLAAEVRVAVNGEPEDAEPTAGVGGANDLAQGDVPLATTEPWLPFGSPGPSADSSQEQGEDPRPPRGGTTGVAPDQSPAVSGPTLSGDAPPLAAPPLPESGPSPSGEPTVEPEPSPEPELSADPEPAPEPVPSPAPEPATEPVPTQEPMPEPDSVLTFDDITSPVPEPEPVVTEPTTVEAPKLSTDTTTTE